MCPCLEQFIVPEAIRDIEKELDKLKLYKDTNSTNTNTDTDTENDTASISELLLADSVYDEYTEKLRGVKRLYGDEVMILLDTTEISQ